MSYSVIGRMTLNVILFYALTLLILTVNAEEYRVCCPYCRSEPGQWVSLGGAFRLGTESDYTKLQSPAAYLTHDSEKGRYKVGSLQYELNYAGAPIKLVYSSMINLQAIVKEQYLQIDMAYPKYVGGLHMQGGYFEETGQGSVPLKKTWVTEFGITYSNTADHSTFQPVRTGSGAIATYAGNRNHDEVELIQLVPGITARFIRIHPLKARSESGQADQVSLRVNVLACEYDACAVPRIDCLLSDWTEWGECTCGDVACSRSRDRTIRRVQACGGSRCGDLLESEECTPPEPAWKAYVMYIGIAGGLIVVGVIIGIIVYKKTHKDDVQVLNDNHPAPAPGPMRKPRPMLGGQAFAPPSVPPSSNPLLNRGKNPFVGGLAIPRQPGFAGALNTMDD